MPTAHRRRKNPVFLSVSADFLINLSVFWFGLAIAGPLFLGIPHAYTWLILTGDILLGILSIVLAYLLRKRIS